MYVCVYVCERKHQPQQSSLSPCVLFPEQISTSIYSNTIKQAGHSSGAIQSQAGTGSLLIPCLRAETSSISIFLFFSLLSPTPHPSTHFLIFSPPSPSFPPSPTIFRHLYVSNTLFLSNSLSPSLTLWLSLSLVLSLSLPLAPSLWVIAAPNNRQCRK